MLNEDLVVRLQNPLTQERDQIDRARILEVFPALGAGSEHHSLVLRKYLYSRPEKFFDRVAYTTYLEWLQTRDKINSTELRNFLAESEFEFGRALLFLREINLEEWHDRRVSEGDDYDSIRFIEKHVHPAYLRLVEGVFTPLLRPLAYFSRLQRNKGTGGLNVWSIVQEISGQNEEILTLNYLHIVRNGIAHGGITFLQRGIRYRDQKGNEDTLDVSYVIRIFDGLLDTCNGIAAALKVFLLESNRKQYVRPREFMVEILQELTLGPWWAIEGCVEAEIASRSQLTVYARPKSLDRAKVFWSSVQSVILAESLAPGYDRYFFSLHSIKSSQGWVAFDGNKLKDYRNKRVNAVGKYQGIVEDDLFYFEPRPRLPALIGKADTLATSIRTAIPIHFRRIREILGMPEIYCRTATVHRNSWGAVLWGSVVVEGVDSEAIVQVIRDNCRLIVKKGKRHAIRANGYCTASFLPIGFAQVLVFRQDYRQRTLSSFGLGEDLVCSVRLQRITRIKAPEIFGSKVETRGKWRIAWNRAWLESVGEHVLCS